MKIVFHLCHFETVKFNIMNDRWRELYSNLKLVLMFKLHYKI